MCGPAGARGQMRASVSRVKRRVIVFILSAVVALATLVTPAPVLAFQVAGQPAAQEGGGEANLILPDLSTVQFRGIDGHTLLTGGLVVCVLGLLFGLMVFTQTKNLPVDVSMREVSELIYETCKTYLLTQGRFILILWAF